MRDGSSGKALANEKISSIIFSNTSFSSEQSIAESNTLSICFSEFDDIIKGSSDSEKYSCKSVQQALSSFCKAEIVNLQSLDKEDKILFEKLERPYDCETPSDDFSGKKKAYKDYLADRQYTKDSEFPVYPLAENDTLLPPNICRLIVDEYNGMRMTDSNGFLYLTIPVYRFLSKGESLYIYIEFSRYFAFIEKTGNSPAEACRKKKFFSRTPKNEESGFSISYNTMIGSWSAANQSVFKNRVCISLNTEKNEIKDFFDIEKYKKAENDYSYFFKINRDDERKLKGIPRWHSFKYPGNNCNNPTTPHFTIFLLTKDCWWDNEKQYKYWKGTIEKLINDGTLKNPIKQRTWKTKEQLKALSELYKKEKKKKDYKNYDDHDQAAVFDDSKINIIAIRKAGFLHKSGQNRPNDIYIVIIDKKIKSIFYGSTDPGIVGVPTIWNWGKDSNSPILKQNPNLPQCTSTTIDINSDGMIDGDPDGTTDGIMGSSDIFIHYGGRGFKEIDENRNLWAWYNVNGISGGCQVVCGSHNIKSDGDLYSIYPDIRKLPNWKYNEAIHKLGGYKNFYKIYEPEGLWSRGEYSVDPPKVGVVYTLIDESNIPILEQNKYYNQYRKILFFRV